MYREFYAMEDRTLRRERFAERIAERNANRRRRPSLRARAARRLFELALAAERQETWRVVWERLDARGRL